MSAAAIDRALVARRLQGEITTEEYYEQLVPHLRELRERDVNWPSEILGPATLKAIESRRQERARDIWVAMMLALDLETCIALLSREVVPIEQLDQEWVRRLGFRQ